jgi:hypothetical protein
MDDEINTILGDLVTILVPQKLHLDSLYHNISRYLRLQSEQLMQEIALKIQPYSPREFLN